MKPRKYEPTKLEAYLQIGSVSPGQALELGANVDVLFQGDGSLPPSTIILNYLYGVAAYATWQSKSDDVLNVMKQYRQTHYAQIPPPPRRDPPLDFTDDSSPEQDNPTDRDYQLESRKRYTSTRRGDESVLGKTMDELNMVLMYLHEITPEVAAERRQKKIEQEERAAQEASRNKVTEWRNNYAF